MSDPSSRPKQVRLSWRSGGWVLALAVLAGLFVLVQLVAPRLLATGGDTPRLGDGEDPKSYGFVLDGGLVPASSFVASGQPREGLRALDDPTPLDMATLDARRAERGGKYVVSHDLVIGVEIGGEARAYPLRVLNWHELVNDTLGGVPIAVSYNPLSGGVAVHDRRVGDETLRFRFSGLLYQSGLLFADESAEPAASSLWSQLQGRALAGPRAGTTLSALPCSLAQWADWRAAHPGTSLLDRGPLNRKKYKGEPYTAYFGDERLRFPVEPLPPAGGRALKTPCVRVAHGGHERLIALPELAKESRPDGRTTITLGELEVPVIVREEPPALLIEGSPESGLEVQYGFWFAWYAQRPALRQSVASVSAHE